MYERPRISYISQFFILLGLVVLGFIIGGLLSLVLWKVLVGGSVFAMEKDMLNPANANAVKIVQLAASLVMFLVPAVIYAAIVNRDPARHLGFKTKFSWAQAGIIFVIVFFGFYLSGALGELTHHIPISAEAEKLFKEWEKKYVDQVMAIANMKSLTDYLFTLIVIAVAPAIFEEVLFRGAMQPVLVNWTRNVWVGIIITSIIFSAIHFSFYGFLARIALGIVLGFIYHYSKSIWLCILAHFLNNGFAVTVMYYYSLKGKLTEDVLDEKFPIWWGIIALILIIVLFVMYRNESKKLGTYYLDNTATNYNNPFSQ